MSRVLAQTRVELVLTLRRGESVLLTIGIPVALLVFFGTTEILPDGFLVAFLATSGASAASDVELLFPGVLAIAVIATAMVSLGIATAFERQQGVLKRLGATPLGRRGLLGAKVLSIVVVIALQVVVLGVVASMLGWRPTADAIPAVAVVALGTIVFASIGFGMAGTMRAEGVLAAANGLFLAFLFLGGVLVPVTRLPAALEAVAKLLPAAPLADALRAALLAGSIDARPVLALAVWAALAFVVAASRFRWD